MIGSILRFAHPPMRLPAWRGLTAPPPPRRSADVADLRRWHLHLPHARHLTRDRHLLRQRSLSSSNLEVSGQIAGRQIGRIRPQPRFSYLRAVLQMLLLQATMLFSAHSNGTEAAGAPCISEDAYPVATVQMTIMTLDSGIETFEAFRLVPEGDGEWARWTSNGYLLDHGRLSPPTPNAFDTLAAAAETRSWFLPWPSEAGPLGRPGFRLDLVKVDGNRIRAKEFDSTPAPFVDVIAELRPGIGSRYLYAPVLTCGPPRRRGHAVHRSTSTSPTGRVTKS